MIDRGVVVEVGSSVRIQDGPVVRDWTIVEHGRGAPTQGRISEDTPLAQALLGKRIGDKPRVNGPEGKWWVVEILHVA